VISRAGGPHEVMIEEIGARGDGVARRGAARIFVPWALPGDRLRVRITGRRGDGLAAEPVERLGEAPRARPPCPHFGACGGCQLQHVPLAQYRAWKRDQVAAALAKHGLRDVAVEPLECTPPGARRRARLAFERRGAAVRLGFRERSGRRVIALRACPVLVPELVALLPPLTLLLARIELARRGGEVDVTASATGVDLRILTAQPPALADREALAAFAAAQDLARISWAPEPDAEAEPIVQRRVPSVRFDQVQVEPPAGAFLQASAIAEGAIRRGVADAIGEARRIADLFAGCGTFGLPLAAAGRPIHAVEQGPAMLAALRQAARRAGFEERVTTEQRDLQRAPLAGGELDRFDAVVVDPPRAPEPRPRRSPPRGCRASRWSPATLRPLPATPGCSPMAAIAAFGSARSTRSCGRAGSSWWRRSPARPPETPNNANRLAPRIMFCHGPRPPDPRASEGRADQPKPARDARPQGSAGSGGPRPGSPVARLAREAPPRGRDLAAPDGYIGGDQTTKVPFV
jgi:23S rRNA (uracil1939-C5)-methyltransferase